MKLIKVTKDSFFSHLRIEESKGRDIMPSLCPGLFPYSSEWKDKRTRRLFGRTEGVMVGGLSEAQYYLAVDTQ